MAIHDDKVTDSGSDPAAATNFHNYPSNREIARPKVVRLFLQGLDAAEIADHLGINLRYCKQIISAIDAELGKLGYCDFRALLVNKFQQICDSHAMINKDLVSEYSRLGAKVDDSKGTGDNDEYDCLVDRRINIGQQITVNNKNFIEILAKLGVPERAAAREKESHTRSSIHENSTPAYLDLSKEEAIREIEASNKRIALWIERQKRERMLTT